MPNLGSDADSSRYPSKVIDPISRRSTCIGRFAECRAARGVGLTGQIGHVLMSTSEIASSVPCHALAIDSLHIDKMWWHLINVVAPILGSKVLVCILCLG